MTSVSGRAVRTGRRAARAVVGVAVVAALTACGPVRSGAAAVVGDTRISTEQLAQFVETGLAQPAAAEQISANRPAYQRDVLSRLIQGRVVQEAAQRRGVSVTEGDVEREYAAIRESLGGEERLRAQAAAAGLTLGQVRDLARTRALSDALGDQLTRDVPVPEAQLRQAYQDNLDRFDQVRTAQVLLPNAADAERLLPEARRLDAAGFAELARTRSQDEATRDRGGDLGFAPRSAFASSGLEAYGEAAFRAEPGDTFAVASSRGGHLVRVLERRTVSPQDAAPELRRVVLQDQREAAVAELLRETARELDIAVNPRFGEWDDQQLSVLEATPSPERSFTAPSGGEDAGEPGADPSGGGQPAPPAEQPDDHGEGEHTEPGAPTPAQ